MEPANNWAGSTLNGVNIVTLDDDEPENNESENPVTIGGGSWLEWEDGLNWDESVDYREMGGWESDFMEISDESDPIMEIFSPRSPGDQLFFSDSEGFIEDTGFNESFESLREVLERPILDQYQTAWAQSPGKDGVLENNSTKPHGPQCEGLPVPSTNKGYKILKGMGWVQGQGLGTRGGGVISPIGANGQRSRSGLGSLGQHQQKQERDKTLNLKDLNSPLDTIKCPIKSKPEQNDWMLDKLVEMINYENNGATEGGRGVERINLNPNLILYNSMLEPENSAVHYESLFSNETGNNNTPNPLTSQNPGDQAENETFCSRRDSKGELGPCENLFPNENVNNNTLNPLTSQNPSDRAEEERICSRRHSKGELGPYENLSSNNTVETNVSDPLTQQNPSNCLEEQELSRAQPKFHETLSRGAVRPQYDPITNQWQLEGSYPTTRIEASFERMRWDVSWAGGGPPTAPVVTDVGPEPEFRATQLASVAKALREVRLEPTGAKNPMDQIPPRLEVILETDEPELSKNIGNSDGFGPGTGPAVSVNEPVATTQGTGARSKIYQQVPRREDDLVTLFERACGWEKGRQEPLQDKKRRPDGEKDQENKEWSLGQASVNWLSPEDEIMNTYPAEADRGAADGGLISYFVNIIIEGVQVRALVDCGASCSVLSSAIINTAECLLEKCKATEKKIRGVGNLSIPMNAVLEAQTTIEKLTTTVNFAVVDAERLPVSAILGNDFLHTHRAIIDMGAGEMMLAGEKIKLIPKYAKRECTKFDALIINEIQLPPWSRMLIPARTCAKTSDGDLGLYFEPARDVHDQVLFGRAVSNGKLGEILVPIINPSAETAIIEAGTRAGKAYIVPATGEHGETQIEEGYHVALIENEKQNTFKTRSEPPFSPKKPSELFDLDGVTEGRDKLSKLLDEFPGVPSRSEYDVGQALLPPMVIDTGEAEPVSIRPRKMGPQQREKMRGHVKNMTEVGILKYSSSSWSAPLVPVTKRDGDVRPCVDLRGLNQVTKFHAYPIPNIEESLSSLSGSRVFSTLDLNKGFHQLRIATASAPKTAFVFEGSLYEYHRVAFGLKNAAGWFQKCMQIMLSGIGIEEVIIYIDDFLIHSPDIESHLVILKKVFERLQAYGLKVKPSKCNLMKEEVDFLGHHVCADGMTPLQARVKAIVEYPKPRTSRELKRFVGMINWYRGFIPNASSLLRPLTRAQSKTKLEWEDSCEAAFSQAKELISSPPVLAFPDYGKDSGKFILTSDGSSDGAGGYLSQVQNGQERVLGYFSKVFAENQAKLSATDKELEGLRECVKFFRHYIIGREVTLRVDHRPIMDMARAKHLNPRLFRIYELLRSFDLTVEYIPGKTNIISDALSRLPNNGATPTTSEPSLLPMGTNEYEISGGGDSLVRAFAKSWLEDQERHQEVRMRIVATIKRDPVRYNLSEMSQKQLKRWEVPGTQLPVETISAIVTAYKVNVKVCQPGTLPMEFTCSDPQATVHLVLRDGIHFNATTKEPPEHQVMCASPIQPEIRLCLGRTANQIKAYQDADPCLVFFREAVKTGKNYDELKKSADENSIKMPTRKVLLESRVTKGILTKMVEVYALEERILVPWLPAEIASALLEEAHCALSHVGETKMHHFAQTHFYANNMKEEVSKVVGRCMECKISKASCGTNKAQSKEVTTKRPYELVAVDLAEFPRSSRGNKFLFLAIDHFSKRAMAKPIRDKSAETIAQEFEYSFLPSFVSIPERILSDNGREFQNIKFQNLMSKYQIKHHTIAPGYPASNGAVERLVGTFKSLIRTACIRGGEWDEELPMTLNAYNNTLHRSLNGKPSEIFLSNAARVVIPRRRQPERQSTHQPFKVGEAVLKKVEVPTSKTCPRFEPGFVVVQVSEMGLTYVIRRRDPKPGQMVFLKAHHNQLKSGGQLPMTPVGTEEGRKASAVKTLNRLAEATQRLEEVPQVRNQLGGTRNEEVSRSGTCNPEGITTRVINTDERASRNAIDPGVSQPARATGADQNAINESQANSARRSSRIRTRPSYLGMFEC